MDLLTGLLWLTLSVYHEARSEDQIAQIAVAHVTLNRARNKNLPIKQVVLSYKQFSWTYLKTDWSIKEPKAFIQCLQSVLIAKQGFDFTGGATHYHERTVKPYWRYSMLYVGDFGKHKFYRSFRQ